jgi:hypothetical protein
MQPKAVGFALTVVTLMAGCDVSRDPTKVLDPSGLKLRAEAINYLTNEKDVPWVINETHPCKPDAIIGSGTSHWIIKTGFDNLGGLHYNATIISKGTGTGDPSAKVYTINEHFKEVENVPGNYTSYIIYEKMRLKVDGPSTDYDYYKTTVVKIVVNSTGETVLSVDSESNSCT